MKTSLFRKDQHVECNLSVGCSTGHLRWDHPKAKQVEEVLETIAYWHFHDAIYPKGPWRLQFDVSPDLTKIVVASTFFETGPFDGQCGVFWRNKDRIAPLVWPAPEDKKE